MALNMNKVGRKKNKADEMLARVELTNTAEQSPLNSTQTTIDSLDSVVTDSPSPVQDSPFPVLDAKGNQDQGLGLNKDGTFRQSKAGRKRKSNQEKKSQIVLTLDSTTISKLESWAENKPRSGNNYLSLFVENHLDEILERIDKS